MNENETVAIAEDKEHSYKFTVHYNTSGSTVDYSIVSSDNETFNGTLKTASGGAFKTLYLNQLRATTVTIDDYAVNLLQQQSE